MWERIKRFKVVVFFIRLFHPGYSHCGICGLPWSNCKYHSVPISERESIFATCQYCWDHKDFEDIIKAYGDLYDSYVHDDKLTEAQIGISRKDLIIAVNKEILHDCQCKRNEVPSNRP